MQIVYVKKENSFIPYSAASSCRTHCAIKSLTFRFSSSVGGTKFSGSTGFVFSGTGNIDLITPLISAVTRSIILIISLLAG